MRRAGTAGRTFTIEDFLRGEEFLIGFAGGETRDALNEANVTYTKILRSWCVDEFCDNPEENYEFGQFRKTRDFSKFVNRHWKKLDNSSKAHLYNMIYEIDEEELTKHNFHWQKASGLFSDGLLENIKNIRLEHAYAAFRLLYKSNKHLKEKHDYRGGFEICFHKLDDDDKLVFVKYLKTNQISEEMLQIYTDKYRPILEKRIDEYFKRNNLNRVEKRKV